MREILQPTKEHPPGPVPATTTSRPKKANILIVDDRPENLVALEAILADLDENVVKAGSGAEALRHVLQDDFALILMDAEMPRLDGYETARLIRMRDRSRHTPIIFLTAVNKDTEQVFQGYSAGAVDYLFKPFVPEILRCKVVSFVEQFRTAQAIRGQSEQMRQMNRELEAANRKTMQLYREVQAKNAELELERDFVATVLQTAGSPVLILDASGKIVRFNHACETVSGYLIEEVRGRQPWEFLLPPGEAASAAANFERIRRSSYEEENTWLARNGEARRIAWCYTPLAGIGGPADYVIATGMDVTARRKAEEVREQMIREQAARLEAEAAQRRFAFLAEASAALFSSLESKQILALAASLPVGELSDWCLIYWKAAGDSLEAVEFAHRDAQKQQAGRALLNCALEAGEDNPILRVFHSGAAELFPEITPEQLDALRGAGHRLLTEQLGWAAACIVPVLARSGALGVVVYGAETLARRLGAAELSLAEHLAQRLAAALENAQLYRKAQESSSAKDQFLATVSHELRTPLNAMLGWARLLRAGKLDPAGSARAIETIERNARAQAQLIEDILDISRIVMGKMQLNLQQIELAPVVEAALDTVRPTAGIKGIRLEADLGGEAQIVFGDPERIQQVAWNLLSNAVKFTPPGGSVSVDLSRIAAGIQLRVTDTGKGIHRDFLPHIFERFSQADATSTRTQGGLGLGLSIVRHLVELHGGSVAAQSEGPGLGATFTVVFPGKAAQMVLPQDDGRNSAKLADLALEGVRILAVDDQVQAREVISVVLGGYGAEVVAVSSGLDALTSLAKQVPDVLIVDIHMPDQDGCDVLAQMRRMQGIDALPALALVARNSPAECERILQSGFRMAIGKPIEAERLAEAVATLSGRAGPERASVSVSGRHRGA